MMLKKVLLVLLLLSPIQSFGIEFPSFSRCPAFQKSWEEQSPHTPVLFPVGVTTLGLSVINLASASSQNVGKLLPMVGILVGGFSFAWSMPCTVIDSEEFRGSGANEGRMEQKQDFLYRLSVMTAAFGAANFVVNLAQAIEFQDFFNRAISYGGAILPIVMSIVHKDQFAFQTAQNPNHWSNQWAMTNFQMSQGRFKEPRAISGVSFRATF